MVITFYFTMALACLNFISLFGRTKLVLNFGFQNSEFKYQNPKFDFQVFGFRFKPVQNIEKYLVLAAKGVK